MDHLFWVGSIKRGGLAVRPYERPMLTKRESLSQVTAQDFISPGLVVQKEPELPD